MTGKSTTGTALTAVANCRLQDLQDWIVSQESPKTTDRSALFRHERTDTCGYQILLLHKQINQIWVCGARSPAALHTVCLAIRGLHYCHLG